jgi:hypothetical protein
MTRREWLGASMLAAAPRVRATPLAIPIHRVVDARARCSPETLSHFWSAVWPEAMIEFGRGGIQLQVEDGPGEMHRTAGGRPVFLGLRRGVLNLVLTDYIPLNWDSGRALPGVTLVYDGYPLSLIAMRFAHGNQFPYFSVNTIVHELMHAFFGDIFVAHPKWYQPATREWRADSQATNLWMFHQSTAIREAAQQYLARVAQLPR